MQIEPIRKGTAMQAVWINRVLELPLGSAFKLRAAQGSALGVTAGLVWITEEGVAEDRFLNAGESYAVKGKGVVIVSAETDARLHLKNYSSHPL
jgi:Protein of unknown function (DUF2917)